MNSRFFRVVGLFLLVLGGTFAHGQLKIAVVDPTVAVLESDEAQELMSEAQKELLPEQERLQELSAEIDELRNRRQTDNEIMSETEKADMDREIEDKQLDLNFGAERFQRRINDERNLIFEQLGPKFQAVLTDLIELEGYDVVFNGNQQIVFYVNPKHNITRKVTERLNDRRGDTPPQQEVAAEGDAQTEEDASTE